MMIELLSEMAENMEEVGMDADGHKLRGRGQFDVNGVDSKGPCVLW